MRNGNTIQFYHLFCLAYRSYPTYEEWKRCNKSIAPINAYSSYPTYEEWKPTFDQADLKPSACSYPTYEEWKLF